MARQPRKLKKALKKAIVIYDVSSIPSGVDVDKIFEMLHNHGMLFYDSKKGNRPKFANKVGGRLNIIDSKNINHEKRY